MPSEYLKRLPRLLRDELVAGRWLPIVGAGLSANAVTPGGKRPPLWDKLGELVESFLSEDYGAASAIDALSSYEQLYGRPALLDRVRSELLVDEVVPGGPNLAFARIPFEVVVTTNLDFVLEQSWTEARWLFEALVGEQRLVNRRRTNATLLVKFHGDVNHPDSAVITENDYDRFIERFPILVTYLTNLLITRVPVLIGYSLDDPDFRSVIALLSNRLGGNGPTPWVLLPKANQGEIERYRRRGVRAVVLDDRRNADRGAVLEHFFDEVADLITRSATNQAESSRDSLLSELREVTTSQSVIVLFIATSQHVAFYRETLFPILEAEGLTPAIVEDIVSEPELSVAARAGLIRRSAAVVVDARGLRDWEAQYAFSQSLAVEDAVILVRGSGRSEKQESNDSRGQLFITAPSDASVEGDPFWLERLIQSILTLVEARRTHDPVASVRARLASGDNTVAFLEAVILVETRLRKTADAKMTFTQLVRANPHIDQTASETLREAYALRGRYLHQGVKPDSRVARSLASRLIDIGLSL